MKRTQIYFPEELHQDLKIGAAVMKVSLSEYIRRIIKEGLYNNKSKQKFMTKKRTNLSIIAKNAINFGIKDLARNFDKYFEASLK